MLEWRLTNYIVVREVPRNNYRSCNLIGHYLFWVISPRNSTLFTRLFLAGRRMRVGHKTRKDGSGKYSTSSYILTTWASCCDVAMDSTQSCCYGFNSKLYYYAHDNVHSSDNFQVIMPRDRSISCVCGQNVWIKACSLL